MSLWHLLVHVMGVDNQLPYGTWNWYNWHSGIEASAPATILLALVAIWWHHTCHAPWCIRWGRYQAAGGTFRLCRHHHPDLKGERASLETIGRLHDEWKKTAA